MIMTEGLCLPDGAGNIDWPEFLLLGLSAAHRYNCLACALRARNTHGNICLACARAAAEGMAVCGAWPVLPGARYGNIYLGYVRELRREHANIRLAYVDRFMRKHAKRISRAAGRNRGV